MAGAHPDLPGPPRGEVAGIGWNRRSFRWPSLSVRMGTEQREQPYSQGPGLAAGFPLLSQPLFNHSPK